MQLKKFLILFLLIPVILSAEIKSVYVLTIDKPITSVIESYISHNIKLAEKQKNTAVLLLIDTPGGALEPTRRIILSIINTSVPVLGYVYPDAARAASAGAFIMLACDKTAMTPLSHMGAAHPVTMGQKTSKIMEEKILNDTLALIKSLSKNHSRNSVYAEKMVTQSLSLTAEECLNKNLIDCIVPSAEKFISTLNNSIITKHNQTFSFSPSVSLISKPMTFFESLIAKAAEPNLAYILLILGFYGIIAEFSAPGIGFAGVFGSLSLLLGFLGMNTISLNMSGLLFIIIAVILFILEVKFQTSGIIAVGAVISFILGSIVLMRNIAVPTMSLSPFLILVMSLLTISFFLFIILMAVKAQKQKTATGQEGLIGMTGTALTDLNPHGLVRIHGEIWKALSEVPIIKGSPIIITQIRHLILYVKKIKE